MHSALKVGGRRLYDYAGARETVERTARQVEVLALELLTFEPPVLKLRVECGKGCYVRTLVRDLAESLGTAGHTSALRRTRVGEFRLEDCLSLDDATDPSLIALRLRHAAVPAGLSSRQRWHSNQARPQPKGKARARAKSGAWDIAKSAAKPSRVEGEG